VTMETATERHHGDLRVFAYRMLGSLLEAERLVEQTFSLATLQLRTLDATDFVRTMLYRILAKSCLGVLDGQSRRTLPFLSHSPADPVEPPATSSDSAWIEPFPDELYPEATYEGVSVYGAREMISLPFIAALQFCPPPERAVIVLRDTMGWKLDEVADVLGVSSSEVDGMLGRARSVMARHYHAGLGRREPPAAPYATALLMQYLYPWETGNLDGLMSRLTGEVTLQVPPSPSWYKGSAAVRQYLASRAFGSGARGRWRLLPRRANGQIAFGTYERDDTGLEYVAHSIQVLTFEEGLVSEIIWFANRSLFPAFKLRSRVIVQGRMAPRDERE